MQKHISSRSIKHQQGFPPQLCILNDLTKRCEVFTRLNKDQEAKEERFLLPPLVDYGVGYTILLKSDTVETSREVMCCIPFLSQK